MARPMSRKARAPRKHENGIFKRAAFLSSYVALRVSSLARSLALACAPVPHPQSGAARAESCDAVAALSFGGELFVGDPLAAGVFNQTVQPVHRVALNVAIVQAESKFVHVPGKVLVADLMVRADD